MMMALASGILLGFSAGLTPGPLFALVLTQSLKHGAREGCKVAVSPLLTDTPIILVTLAVAAHVAALRSLMGLLSFAGGTFVLYLAWDSLRPIPETRLTLSETPRSWLKGALTNLLNPHAWLFWMTVGAASLAQALAQGWQEAAVFLLGFYLLLIGSKMVLAVLTARSRNLLAGRGYRLVMRILAVLLALFAVVLFREGIKQMTMSSPG